MLVVPLVLGLIIAPGWEWRALILIPASLGFFLVRYPLALLVKTRRRTTANRTYLWQWTGIYGLVTTVAGVWLVFAERLWWLVVIALIGGVLMGGHLWLVARRQEMSLTGELVGIAGLALGAPMAYYTVTRRLDGIAIVLWLLNALYFGGTVFYVKLKVRQQPRQPAPDLLSERLVRAKACLVYQMIALTLIILLVALRQASWLAPLALLPATVKIVVGAGQWQDKRSLNIVRLGLTEMVHALVFAGLVILAF